MINLYLSFNLLQGFPSQLIVLVNMSEIQVLHDVRGFRNQWGTNQCGARPSISHRDSPTFHFHAAPLINFVAAGPGPKVCFERLFRDLMRY